MNQAPLQILNRDTLNKLQHEMADGFDEVYAAIMESLHGHIEDLEKYSDPETRIRMLHSLKAPAASLGAEQLAKLAAIYEKRATRKEDIDIQAWITLLRRNLAELEQALISQGLNLP